MPRPAAEKLEQEQTIIRLVKLVDWCRAGQPELTADQADLIIEEVGWLLQSLRAIGYGTYKHAGQGGVVLPPPPRVNIDIGADHGSASPEG